MVTDELQIASYNVNGLENKRKRLQIFTWLKEKKYSMICLQETLSVPADLWRRMGWFSFVSPWSQKHRRYDFI